MTDYGERVKTGFEAFNRRDFDTMTSFAAPDVEWTPPAELPGSRTYSGHAGMREAINDLLDIFPDLQAEAVRVSEDGSRVVALYLWHVRAPGSDASLDPFEIHAGGIFDFDENDLIRTGRFWTTWEETEAAAEKERARQEAGP